MSSPDGYAATYQPYGENIALSITNNSDSTVLYTVKSVSTLTTAKFPVIAVPAGHTVTHTGFVLCGINGAKRLKSYFRPQQKGYKSPQRSRNPIRASAHNRSAGGSSPPPATKKPLKSHDFSGFPLLSALRLGSVPHIFVDGLTYLRACPGVYPKGK